MIYVSFHFLSICELHDNRTIASVFAQLWSIFDLRTISPWATRGKKHCTLAEVGLGQNGLTVFCIRHHRLLVSGGRFSVSSDGSLWHSQSERSSSRRIRSNDRRVSDLGDLDEISSSYADRISDRENRSALRCVAGGAARIAKKDRRRDRV